MQFVFLMWIAGIPATNHQSFVYAQVSQQLLQQQNVATSIKVAAGGGNDTGPLTLFLPSKIGIKAGQSVTWYNPTTVGEPHTVTFIFDNTTYAGVVSPLGVSKTTKFLSLPPVSNNAPILLPNKDGTNTIIALNARTFNPTVIDSSGNVNYMNPNANYTKLAQKSMLIQDGFFKRFRKRISWLWEYIHS